MDSASLRRFWWFGSLSALLLAAPTGPALAAPNPSPPTGVVVVFADGVPAAKRAQVRAATDTRAVRKLGRDRFQLVQPAPGQSVGDAVAELRRSPGVASAEPNRLLQGASIPNDPSFGDLWGLLNTGQDVDGFGGNAVPGSDIDASLAWDRTVGAPSVALADIDSGYRFDHPDLAPVAWSNPGETPGDAVDNDSNGYVDDWRGWDTVSDDPNDVPQASTADGPAAHDGSVHGVHTAGTIGAKGNNGIGVTGVTQNARIMPVRACFGSSDPPSCAVASVVEAINYAGGNGARATNLSINGPADTRFPTVTQALAANPTTLYVAAAGNNGTSNDVAFHSPCEDPTVPYSGYTPPLGTINNVVCVAATDPADALASFSNYGAASVHLGAPGVRTLSTEYETMDVTSLDPPGFQDAGWGFGSWTTPVPPASDASHGWELADPCVPSSPGCIFTFNEDPGTTAATQTPAMSVPAGLSACNVHARYDAVGEEGEDRFTVAVLVDGVEVQRDDPPMLPVPAGVDEKVHNSGWFDLPPSQTGHTVAVRFIYHRGLNGATPDAGAQFFRTGDDMLRCERADATYGYLSGTSQATPHVTGTAGLLFSLKPTATVTQVRNALLASVDQLPSLAGQTVTGGRLNAWKALAALVPMDTRITGGPSGSVQSSTASFSFDSNQTGNAGFQCSLDGGPVQPCASPRIYTGLGQGNHSFSVRSAVAGGVDATPAVRAWEVSNPILGAPDLSGPVVGRVGVKPTTFAARSRGGSVAARAKLGTKISYRLSEAAAVSFGIEARKAGRRVGKKCRKPTKRNRSRRKCDLRLKGSFRHNGKAGKNSFTFTGRLRSRKLKSGRYNLVATATDSAGNKSRIKRARFRVVKRR